MDNKENSFGKKIKEIREKNNLTQKDLADTLNVTYQAVSKWERGENYPDLNIIRKISSIYKIDINELMDIELGTRKNNKLGIILVLLIILIIIFCLFILNKSNSNFELKSLTTNCTNFKLTGSIAYNKDKSSIYISSIDYCGVDEDIVYKTIKSTLYESNGESEVLIASEEKDNISIKDYLTDLTIHVDNYKKTCKKYTELSIYIKIELIEKDNKSIFYTIPLSLNDNCN